MVRDAVRYLLSTIDRETHVWRIAPVDTGDFPHAPWWDDEGGSLGRLFDGFLINPRADIVALLYHYSPLVPSDWLDDVTERTVEDIETIELELTLARAGLLDGKRYAYGYATIEEGIYSGTGVVQDGLVITSGTCPYQARLTGRPDGTAELTQKLIETVIR